MKVILKMQFDIGVFETEKEAEDFIQAICDIANSHQKQIKDASAAMMVIVDDPSELPQEVRDEIEKRSKNDKIDPKKYIN